MARDVQSERPANSFKLTKVGVKGVMKPVQVSRPRRSVTLPATFDVVVDIPATQRGSHLSRHLERIGEVVDASVRGPLPGLEYLAQRLAASLPQRPEAAT